MQEAEVAYPMLKPPFRQLVLALGSIAIVSVAWSSPSPAAPRRPAAGESCGTWTVVPSPNVGTGDNTLNSIDAVAADDIWAVGSPGLTEHWDGVAWSVVPFPSAIALNAVAAVASDDVWVVGGSTTAHWDGLEWTIVPNPNVGTLADVTAVASNDAWAAGSTTIDGKTATLTEHWDGMSWRVVPSPNRGVLFSYFDAISAASATDVWAMGTYYSTWAESARTLGEHWDGSRWSIVSTPNGSPNIPLQAGHFYAVKAVSADDAWAVGTHFDYVTSQHGITAHWDGTRWQSVRADAVDRDSDLFGVDALPGNHAWAVGESFDKYSGEGTNDLIYRLEPDGWTADLPPEGLDIDQLHDVAVAGPGDVWAVGFDIDDQSPTLHTLVERCS